MRVHQMEERVLRAYRSNSIGCSNIHSISYQKSIAWDAACCSVSRLATCSFIHTATPRISALLGLAVLDSVYSEGARQEMGYLQASRLPTGDQRAELPQATTPLIGQPSCTTFVHYTPRGLRSFRCSLPNGEKISILFSSSLSSTIAINYSVLPSA